MRRAIVRVLLGVVLAALAGSPAGAEDLTVNSILAAQQAGAPADGIIALVNDPANTIAMTAGDIVTLRRAGVPERVLTAIWAHVPAPSQPFQPDDARLDDVVRLTASGMSDANIAEQVRQSGKTYNLSVNDLLYLKQNDVEEWTISALMATGAGAPAAPGVAPSELVFDDLVQLRRGFWKKNREGRLVLRGDTFSWEDDRGSDGNFQFETAGIDKVWLTCEARSSGNFCHQINFKIVKGDSYRFQDKHRETGSNAAVEKVMEALRTYYPRLTFATPTVDD